MISFAVVVAQACLDVATLYGSEHKQFDKASRLYFSGFSLTKSMVAGIMNRSHLNKVFWPHLGVGDGFRILDIL